MTAFATVLAIAVAVAGAPSGSCDVAGNEAGVRLASDFAVFLADAVNASSAALAADAPTLVLRVKKGGMGNQLVALAGGLIIGAATGRRVVAGPNSRRRLGRRRGAGRRGPRRPLR